MKISFMDQTIVKFQIQYLNDKKDSSLLQKLTSFMLTLVALMIKWILFYEFLQSLKTNN